MVIKQVVKKEEPKTIKITEPKGNLKQRIYQINEICKSHRPQGRIIGIKESPNRTKEQLVTLSDVDGTIFAVPVNQKLPWFSVGTMPEEFYTDQAEGKKIGHRYYISKY